MKKIVALVIILVLVFAIPAVALAKIAGPTPIDRDGNPVNWISFTLLKKGDGGGGLASEVNWICVSPLDYRQDALYAAAQAAFPDKAITELGGITMSAYNEEWQEYDYWGPFKAKVQDANVHKGDRVVVFVAGEDEEIPVQQVEATNIGKGHFSFRASAAAYCVYVILHNKK